MHVVTRPLQWACHDVVCECEFEQLIELDGTGVHVTATLHNHRTDKYNEAAPHSQELPAVYTNGPWHRLVTYSGTAPWTNAPTTEIPMPGPQPPWNPGAFHAAENWAAMLDENDWGLGVVNPAQTTFLGGFSGKPGSGGPHDPQTGYLAPTTQVALPHDVTYTFEFWLALGNLETIRSYAYQKTGH